VIIDLCIVNESRPTIGRPEIRGETLPHRINVNANINKSPLTAEIARSNQANGSRKIACPFSNPLPRKTLCRFIASKTTRRMAEIAKKTSRK
jgi:hypothetical protein